MQKQLSLIRLVLVALLVTGSASASFALTNLSWSEASELTGPARTGAAGFTLNNKGYLGTGSDASAGLLNDFWEYDPATNTWQQRASFAGSARTNAVGFAVAGKGYIGTGENGSYLNDFWSYNPGTNSWAPAADMPGDGRASAVSFVVADSAFVGTGRTALGLTASFYKLNAISGNWSAIAAFPGTARESAAAFSIGTSGYVLTGNDGTLLNDAYEYSTVNTTWYTKNTAGSSGRQGAVAGNIDGTIYMGLGQTSSGFTADLYYYDQLNDNWSLELNFDGPQVSDAVLFSLVNNQGFDELYVATGNTSSGPSKQNWRYSEGLDVVISTENPASTTLCPGSTFPVAFSYNYPVNAQNVFTVQLSDASGSFSNPTVLGSMASQDADTILVTIPTGLTAGNGYRIRVVGSSPAGSSPDNGSNLILSSTPCTYFTIDQTAPASSTNFQSFNMAALMLGNGISSSTIISVVPGSGPYTQQAVIGEIPGASPTNLVTINGNGETISYCNGQQVPSPAIKLDGADYVTIENFNIQTTCIAWGIQVAGDVSGIRIVNNSIEAMAYGGRGIVATNAANYDGAPAGNINGLFIADNNIMGGYTGIRINGNPASPATGVVVDNNTFFEPAEYGLYLTHANAPVISNNTLDMSPVRPRSTGMYLSQIENGITVYSNDISQAGQVGIRLNNINTSSAVRGQVVNNAIGGGFQSVNTAYGLLLNNASRLDVYHNSVNLDHIGTGAAFMLSSGPGAEVDVRNNIFNYTGFGSAYGISVPSARSFTHLDYNAYSSTSGNLALLGGVTYADLASLQLAPAPVAHNQNSLSAAVFSPGSTSLTLPFLSSLAAAGTGVGVTHDIIGLERDMFAPSLGAYEADFSFFPFPFPPLRQAAPAVLAEAGAVEMQAYPNPFGNELTVRLASEGTAQVALYDLAGREMMNRTVAAAEAGAAVVLHIADNVPQGMYLLHVRQGETVKQLRVVKQ